MEKSAIHAHQCIYSSTPTPYHECTPNSKVHLVTGFKVKTGVHISQTQSWGTHPCSCVLLCGRQWRWEADGKSIVMDQSAAWLEPCGVRVRGTTMTFYTSSLLLIILFSSPPTPILSFHLEIPTPLCLPPTLSGILRVCVYVKESERERWLDTLCHGVRWHQPVADGKIKCNTVDIRALKLFSFPAAFCATCVHISVAVTWGQHSTHKRDVIHKAFVLLYCLMIECKKNWCCEFNPINNHLVLFSRRKTLAGPLPESPW